MEFRADAEILTESVRDELRKKGFVYPTEEVVGAISEEDKTFPTEVSDLPQEILLDKLATFTTLYAAAAMGEAKYAVEVNILERDLEFSKAAASHSSTATKVTDKRQEVAINEKVVRLQEKISIAETYLKTYTVLRTNYEKFCFMLSRALTVRGEESRLQ